MSDQHEQEQQQQRRQLARRNALILMAIVVEGGLIGVAVFCGWLLEQRPLSRFALDPWAVLWGVLATLPLLALFLVVARWPVGPFRSISEFTERYIRPALAPCTLVDLLGISCLAGVGEEMLFRGVFQDWLSGALLSPVWALVLASALFGLVHAVTPSYAVVAASMGGFLGWLYLATGNLLAPMVTHALYDFCVLLWLMRGPGSAEALIRIEEEEEEARKQQEEGEEEPGQ